MVPVNLMKSCSPQYHAIQNVDSNDRAHSTPREWHVSRVSKAGYGRPKQALQRSLTRYNKPRPHNCPTTNSLFQANTTPPVNMANRYEREAEDLYESKNDPSPVTGSFSDSSYAKETKSSLRGQVPVQGDNQRVDDPMQPPYSNSDQQLGKINILALTDSVSKDSNEQQRRTRMRCWTARRS